MDNEWRIRLAAFLATLVAMACWEAAAPRRRLRVRRRLRWTSNLGLLAINTLAVRAVFALGAVGAALFAAERGWGLFNYAALPAWIEMAAAIVLLDLAVYLQHVMFHAVPALWRLHMVHHADLDFDFTTGVRFHTLEMLLSLGLKSLAVLMLGASVGAVVAFEVLLNAVSMFNHSNVRMPDWVDKGLRALVVTPDMHRVHHSVRPEETNSNFGFNLAWWDRLLGTYRAQPAAGHEQMSVGLAQFPDERADRLDQMLLAPFRSGQGEDSFCRDTADSHSASRAH